MDTFHHCTVLLTVMLLRLVSTDRVSCISSSCIVLSCLPLQNVSRNLAHLSTVGKLCLKWFGNWNSRWNMIKHQMFYKALFLKWYLPCRGRNGNVNKLMIQNRVAGQQQATCDLLVCRGFTHRRLCTDRWKYNVNTICSCIKFILAE